MRPLQEPHVYLKFAPQEIIVKSETVWYKCSHVIYTPPQNRHRGGKVKFVAGFPVDETEQKQRQDTIYSAENFLVLTSVKDHSGIICWNNCTIRLCTIPVRCHKGSVN